MPSWLKMALRTVLSSNDSTLSKGSQHKALKGALGDV
jgi:hypothetical protein